MQTEPTPSEPQPIHPQEILPATTEKKLLAPIWHTALLIVIMLANSYLTASFLAAHRQSHPANTGPRTWDYAFTIAFELFLLGLVWIGLRLKKATLRQLIGGRWNTPEDFLIDLGIAIGFWFVSAAILVALAYALGQADTRQINEMKERLGGLIPQSGQEVAVWVSLSIIAGFVEEIIFRGYLQQQIGILAGNAYAGLIVSALIFGAGHGYEGTRNMIRIFVFGALFGILAIWRKSLRPGMIAHAWQDALAGVGAFFLSKHGMF
jgi:membrane protease YdiL (CAAX protease family)